MAPCVSVHPGTVGQLPRVGPWKAENATPGHWAVTFTEIWTGLDDGGGKSQEEVKKAQATSSLVATRHHGWWDGNVTLSGQVDHLHRPHCGSRVRRALVQYVFQRPWP